MQNTNYKKSISYRKQKIEKLIKIELMQTLITVNPELNKQILVTDTVLSNNLRNATAYFIYQNNKCKESSIQHSLNQLVPQIKKSLCQVLRTKYLPNIIFRFDSNQQQTNKISDILKQLEPIDNTEI